MDALTKSLDELFALAMIYERLKKQIFNGDLDELKLEILNIKNIAATSNDLQTILENLDALKLSFMQEILLLEDFIKDKNDNLRS